MSLKDVQVAVLMGGLGTRLGDRAASVPKALMPVGGRPFFEHMLRLLRQQGAREFVFLVSHLGEAIEAHFGDGAAFGVSIHYSYDGDQPLGTGGALRNALPLLENQVVVMYGDSYLDIDLAELLCHYRYHRDRGRPATLAVFKNKGRYDRSNVLFRAGELLAYDKHSPAPEMEHIDYGISVLSRSVIEGIPGSGPVDLADVYRTAIAERRMAGMEVTRRFYEIGTPESLDELCHFIAARSKKRPAILLDRDGTLNEIVFNEDTELLDSPLKIDQFRLLPGVIQALQRLQALGYLLVVITNQPAAAKGKTSLLELYRINAAMDRELREAGVEIDDIMMCPHHPVGNPARCRESDLIVECECRKPGSLLIRQTIDKHNVDIERSYFVGDSFVDVLAARKEDLRTVFLGRYKCDLCERLGGEGPDLTFDDLSDFASSLEEQS